MTHQITVCNYCENELDSIFDKEGLKQALGIRVFARAGKDWIDDIPLDVSIRKEGENADLQNMNFPFQLGRYCGPRCLANHLMAFTLAVEELHTN